AESPGRMRLIRELLGTWPDGRIKMFVTWALLQLRKQHAQTFLSGSYRSLRVGGRRRNSLVAYARDDIIIVAPRLVYPIFKRTDEGMPYLDWTNEYIALTAKLPRRYTNIFTNAEVRIENERRPRLDAVNLLKDFPVAVLLPA
ncbi:MAG: hypothetical protein ACREML_03105, partial [Vulcanimicrobiaceae bacterium]